MQIHHLSPGAMQPPGGAFFDGRTPGFGPAELVCHCLLLETSAGLVLVDTGIVARDANQSAARLGAVLIAAFAVRLRPEEAAINQLDRLGLRPADVKHIVMTHLDFDHVGGLPDFPQATVHLSRTEADAARSPAGPKERIRYAAVNEMRQSNWHTYDTFPADCFGLPASYLDGIPGLMLVPLPGHTRGHCGVAIDLGGGQWLLHAGDAIMNAHELAPDHPSTPTGARLLQWSMEAGQRSRRRSLAQLRRDQPNHLEIICTHDPAQLAEATTEHATTPRRAVLGGG